MERKNQSAKHTDAIKERLLKSPDTIRANNKNK
jgi:hypothetical protein